MIPPPEDPRPVEPESVPVRRRRRVPWATYTLIGATAFVFVLQVLSALILGQDLPLAWGAKANALIGQGELWRLITPLVLHAGFLHAAFNLYALAAIGQQAEVLFGARRFLAVYLVAGMGGVLASYLLTVEVSVGASSAIFGLVGAMLVFFYRHRRALGEFGRRGMMNLLVVAGINLVLGLSPGIDNWGHLGGLTTGALLAVLLGPEMRLERVELNGDTVLVDRRPFRRTWPLAVLAALVMLGLAILIPRP